MKSSTIMVLQTNKQNSVLLINFTVLFLCRKGDICLKYEAAEMCGQCRNVYWITGIGKRSSGKIHDGTLKEMTIVQKTLQLFLYLHRPVYSIFAHKFKNLI